jgi:hypothetical protein
MLRNENIFIEEQKSFVKQSPACSDQMCGSYALAYYKWLTNKILYSENDQEDRNEVINIYKNVVFGNAYDSIDITGMGRLNLSEANHPVKMLDYAIKNLHKINAAFYYDGENKSILDMKDSIQSKDNSLFKKYETKIFSTGIPQVLKDQYAIVLFYGLNGSALHWILFHRKLNGQFEYFDPYFGMPIIATDFQMRGKEEIDSNYPFGNLVLISLNSCLMLS